MSSQNVLQTINCNIREIDQSPLRKKPRMDITSKGESSQRWSLSQRENELDVLAEMGLGMLDTDDLPDCKTSYDIYQPSTSNIESQNNVTNPELINSPEKYSHENNHKIHREKSDHKKKKDKKQKRKDMIESSKNWEDFCLYKRSSIINQEESKDWFNELSDEIVLMIFRWIPKKSLSKCALVCKRWHRLTADETLWSRLDCSVKVLDSGSLGQIISRQVILLKLAQSEVMDPSFLPNSKAHSPDFCSKLMYLDLSMALISIDTLSTLLSKCNRIRKISLEACQVNDQVCAHLARNENLEILNMSMAEGLTYNGLTRLLKHCVQIKELNIAWTCLTVESISLLCNKLPKNLVRLNISGCRKTLNNIHIRDLVNCCPNLVELDLSDCTALTNDVIKFIAVLNKLDCLALSRCYGIHWQSLRKLGQMTSLMYLDIHGGHISAPEIEELRKCLGNRIEINKFMFSSIARPTVGLKRSSIWGLRVKD